ncbi:MAG: hypothetical protein AAGE94_23015, partial [Acidobacteriota bacterium]
MSDLLVILALPLALATATTDTATVPTEADAVTTTAPVDSSGFLYGRIETRHDTYEGRLVWRRDRFWTDFLDATKSRRPHVRRLPREALVRTESFEVFGRTFERERHEPGSRALRIRYGDIARLEPHSTAWTTVVLRDGHRLDAEGSWDLSRPVTVIDGEGEETAVDWRRIRTITFLPTPTDLPVTEQRLYGTVVFRRDGEEETARGYFRWDRDEATTTAVLDGETADGQDHEIPFGEIRQLEQRDNRTLVTLDDDTELLLGGTNDVDASNRGLDLVGSDFRQTTLEWEDLVRVELEPPPGSGPAYDSFPPPRPLSGSVTTTAGEAFEGWLAFDADEDANWEILDIDTSMGELSVPFGRIESIARSDDATWPWTVALRDGETLPSDATDDLG